MYKLIKNFIKNNETLYTLHRYFKQMYFKFYFNDKRFIQKKFKKRLGREVNLENPQKFNDKLQWLKLNWYDPLAVKCADKYAVREFVKDKIGEKYLNELYGVYSSVNEINLDELPEKFVLKGTHGSGLNIICKDKNKMNWKKAKKKMKRWMITNHYWQTREWVYKDIKPRIIAEKFIETNNNKPLKDYKFFCFNGEVKSLFVAKNRGIGTTFDFYDLDWNWLEVKNHYPNSNKKVEKPEKLDKMICLAKKLSKKFPQVRVDFYYENKKIYFGELTFFHFSGFESFEPESFDIEMGKWLDLNKIN